MRTRSENRAKQPCFALKPANPNCGVTSVAWAIPYNKLVISITNSEAKIPSEILLFWSRVHSDVACMKLLDEPVCYIVTVTTIVDEVVLPLRRVECQTLESNKGANL